MSTIDKVTVFFVLQTIFTENFQKKFKITKFCPPMTAKSTATATAKCPTAKFHKLDFGTRRLLFFRQKARYTELY